MKDTPLVIQQFAIENGHRNSGFSELKWVDFPLLCKRLPEGMKSPYSPNNLYRESYAMIMYDHHDGHDGLHGL